MTDRKNLFPMKPPLTFVVTLGILATSSGANADADTSGQVEYQARPSCPQPDLVPPAPPISIAPAPGDELAVPQAPTAPATSAVSMPAGQWVYTQEYGWLWMPYHQKYAHVAESASRLGHSTVAYEYAYYPASGWRWVVAPWVLRFGAVPYWGALGPEHFAWYAHPWFRIASLEGSRHDEPVNGARAQKP
jgi:hypothetical protein